jgi:hypothetical protein
MAADWDGLAFELGTWKATGTYILKGDRAGKPAACSLPPGSVDGDPAVLS